ncbi:hypothetical protein VKT23_016429 [Stygiomarasmius scandens]|uniref:Uncharacterized protein n=1 Tax=Marasmiellus scandens TaxID=2682957 RepID=A0ABR1IUS9_9AGAR
MYAYYQNAVACYAYLADVRRQCEFTSSEWWERGWTLQELLAPPQVYFYDRKWRRIGNKQELKAEIAELTAIPREVLSGQRSIHDVDVLERMSWATGRETTKPQDRAYCLMGLLDVSIEPDYEERVAKSFERLWMALVRAHPEYKEASEFEEEKDELDFYRMLHGKLVDAKMRVSLHYHHF